MGTSFEQFRACLTRSVARQAIGINLSDEESARIAQDDVLARAYYENWLRTGPTRRVPPARIEAAAPPQRAPAHAPRPAQAPATRVNASRSSNETKRSIWRTWKPYVVITILAGGAIWWWTDQSPFATPRDGVYACELVDIGSDGKYTRLADATGTAEVRDGELLRVEAAGGNLAIDGVTIQPRGTSHFRVFEGEVGALATPVGSAIACTYTSG